MLSFDLALRIPKLTMATAAKQSCTADWRWPTLIMVNGLLGGTAAATSQRLNDFWPREQSTRALERAHRRRPLAGAAATQSGRSARTPETERERWREIERDPTIGGTAQSSRQFRRKTPISSWHAMASSSTAKMTDVVRPIRLSLPLSLSLSSSLCFVSAFLLLLLLFSFSHFWLRFSLYFLLLLLLSYHIQWSLNRLRFWTVSRSAPTPECSFSSAAAAAALCFCFRPYIVFTGRLFL